LANMTLKDVVARLKPCVSATNGKSVSAATNGKRKQVAARVQVSARN